METGLGDWRRKEGTYEGQLNCTAETRRRSFSLVAPAVVCDTAERKVRRIR
jgi:hypothetical protein